MTVRLTGTSLRSVPFTLHPETFTFVTDDGTYSCSVFAAELLSPKVCRLRSVDITLSEYHVTTRSEDGLFRKLLKAATGEALEIREQDVRQFVALCRELENIDLLSQIPKWDELSVENAVEFLEEKVAAHDTDLEREVEFIAEHFYEIDDATLDKFKVDVISQILAHKKLTLLNEDTLFEFVMRLIRRDVEYACLLEFVHFEFLGDDTIRRFANESWSFLAGCMNRAIWERICDRLVWPVTIESQEHLEKFNTRYRDGLGIRSGGPAREQFPVDQRRPLRGILAHLTDKCGGNVIDHEVIRVVSSPKSMSKLVAVRNLFDLEGNNYFQSVDEPNQSVTIDFKDMRVGPTGYSIRTCNDGPGAGHPRSWVVEASNDGFNWVEIDRKDNCDDLNGKLITATFSTKCDGVYRMIRFRLTGPSHNGHNYIIMRAFELFGMLQSE